MMEMKLKTHSEYCNGGSGTSRQNSRDREAEEEEKEEGKWKKISAEAEQAIVADDDPRERTAAEGEKEGGSTKRRAFGEQNMSAQMAQIRKSVKPM